jgi:hypothetical protein
MIKIINKKATEEHPPTSSRATVGKAVVGKSARKDAASSEGGGIYLEIADRDKFVTGIVV